MKKIRYTKDEYFVIFTSYIVKILKAKCYKNNQVNLFRAIEIEEKCNQLNPEIYCHIKKHLWFCIILCMDQIKMRKRLLWGLKDWRFVKITFYGSNKELN